MGGMLASMAMRLLTFASAVSSSCFLLLSWGYQIRKKRLKKQEQDTRNIQRARNMSHSRTPHTKSTSAGFWPTKSKT